MYFGFGAKQHGFTTWLKTTLSFRLFKEYALKPSLPPCTAKYIFCPAKREKNALRHPPDDSIALHCIACQFSLWDSLSNQIWTNWGPTVRRLPDKEGDTFFVSEPVRQKEKQRGRPTPGKVQHPLDGWHLGQFEVSVKSLKAMPVNGPCIESGCP